MELKHIIIETENLILQPIELKYSEIIFKEFTEDISLYMLPKPSDNIKGVEQFIESSIEGLLDGSNLQLVAISRETGEFIGCVGLHYLGSKDPELGLWIKKGAHGNAYGLEAITSLIGWARENIDFEYLRYPVDRRNHASRRIPERNGGEIKKEYKEINQMGFELDTVEYYII